MHRGIIMTNSNIKPNNITPDFGTLKNGKLDILVNWNITAVTKMGIDVEYTSWDYESVRLNWILPTPMTTREEIQLYLDDNYSTGENILGWAQATKITI